MSAPIPRKFYLSCSKAELRRFYETRTGKEYPERPSQNALVKNLLQLDQERTFQFFKLPKELRFTVYELLVERKAWAETLAHTGGPVDRFAYLKTFGRCSKEAHEDADIYIYTHAKFSIASRWSVDQPLYCWKAITRSWYSNELHSYLNCPADIRRVTRVKHISGLKLALERHAKVQNLTIMIDMRHGCFDHVLYWPYSASVPATSMLSTLRGLIAVSKSLRSITIVMNEATTGNLEHDPVAITDFLLHSIPMFTPRVTLKLRDFPKDVENVFWHVRPLYSPGTETSTHVSALSHVSRGMLRSWLKEIKEAS